MLRAGTVQGSSSEAEPSSGRPEAFVGPLIGSHGYDFMRVVFFFAASKNLIPPHSTCLMAPVIPERLHWMTEFPGLQRSHRYGFLCLHPVTGEVQTDVCYLSLLSLKECLGCERTLILHPWSLDTLQVSPVPVQEPSYTYKNPTQKQQSISSHLSYVQSVSSLLFLSSSFPITLLPPVTVASRSPAPPRPPCAAGHLRRSRDRASSVPRTRPLRLLDVGVGGSIRRFCLTESACFDGH